MYIYRVLYILQLFALTHRLQSKTAFHSSSIYIPTVTLIWRLPGNIHFSGRGEKLYRINDQWRNVPFFYLSSASYENLRKSYPAWDLFGQLGSHPVNAYGFLSGRSKVQHLDFSLSQSHRGPRLPGMSHHFSVACFKHNSMLQQRTSVHIWRVTASLFGFPAEGIGAVGF